MLGALELRRDRRTVGIDAAGAQPSSSESRSCARRRRAEDAADRRKALELLAEALADEGNPGLAEAAERLAWAEPPPSAEGALELADAAETAGTPSVEVMS